MKLPEKLRRRLKRRLLLAQDDLQRLFDIVAPDYDGLDPLHETCCGIRAMSGEINLAFALIDQAYLQLNHDKLA